MTVEAFEKNFYEHYDLLDPVLNSYDEVYSEIMNIITKFDLKYPYQTKDPKHADEFIMVGIELTEPKIIKPGENVLLPKTQTQAIAEKKDFMCIYEFDAKITIKLKTDNNEEKRIKQFIQLKKEDLDIKEFDKKYYSLFLQECFEEYVKINEDVDQISISAGKFIFELPVMTMSILDPVKTMTPRERYNAGCNINERGGDIVLAGVPYLIENGYSYPYGQPIIAKSTNIQGQLIRADYLYQQDPIYGNVYQSIFLLIENKTKREKSLGLEAKSSNDLVLNFKESIDINFNPSDNFIPVSLLFRAYGCNNDDKLLRYCNPENKETTKLFFIDLFEEGEIHEKYMGQKRKFTQLEALYEIGKIIAKNNKETSYEDVFAITEIAEEGLSKYIYPIILGEESPYCQTLGEICNSIYEAYLSPDKFTDRDALYNKRVVMVGPQVVAEMRGKMFESFKSSVKGFLSEIDLKSFEELKDQQTLYVDVMKSLVNQFSKNFSAIIKKSFTSSQEGVKITKNFNEQKTEHLSVSEKREIIIKPQSAAVGAKGIGYDERKIEKSHFGFICYITTPESGENVGRYLSPTIYSYITISEATDKVEKFLEEHKLFTKVKKDGKNYMSVKINYQTKGYVEWGKSFRDLYDDLIEWRRQNSFKDPKTQETITDYKEVENICKYADQLFTTIYCSVDYNEINVCTDAGRIVIPIFKNKTDDDFVKKILDGNAMFVCSAMIQFYIVEEWSCDPVYPKTWFLGPSGALGILPATNALQNHNKAIRATYSTSQMKNSESQCVQNYSNYYLKNMLILNENQKQVVSTSLSDIIMSDVPLTQMIYIGIMPFTDNEEDAMIICDDFIERNGFATTSYKTYMSTPADESEAFEIPQQVRKEYNYSKLNQIQNQITNLGTIVKENDVLIAKVKIMDRTQKIDESVVYDITEDGEYSCVCNVNNYTFYGINNIKCVRVMLSRIPSIGDKVVSTNAEKSTIGKILLGCDMPIDEEGIVLNLIEDTNPIMKRETYGQSLEILLGKYALKHNRLRFEVSQDEPLTDDIIEELGKLELDKMYRPDVDELFENPVVLSGVINYTVQKHLVDEKIRFRSDYGKLDAISKQSATGKKVQGGLRISDMERQAICASGASNLLKNFFGKQSSNMEYIICKKCGCIGVNYDKNVEEYYCKMCGVLENNDFLEHGFSYNGVLLDHILKSSGIEQNFIFDEMKW